MPQILHSSSEFDVGREALLRVGDTVWQQAHADRVAVLVDGATYYGALRKAMLAARHSIFIIGWDIDSRTRLVGPSGGAEDGAPERLGDFLSHLASDRDGLDIYVLPWDYSLLFLRERELLPMGTLRWRMPPGVHVCVDGTAPVGASHHQKLVVIDDSVAFCGGLDLTLRRWDTPSHDYSNPGRVDPAGAPYGPYHDLQMVVDGDAAKALGMLARRRWDAASKKRAKPAAKAGDPWPASVRPDFENTYVGIARTEPQHLSGQGIHEVERLYLRAIATAERTIYIENQYLHSDTIAEALVKRAEARPELEIVVVSNQDSGGWIEERTMGIGRRRFLSILQRSAAAARIRVLRSTVSDGGQVAEIHIHAKLQIIDDTLLRIGSANINRRSMGVDTECDLALEARNDDERRRIGEFRDQLIGHHLGRSGATVREAIGRHGSLIAAIDATGGGPSALQPIDPSHPAPFVDEHFELSLADAADPKAPPSEAALSAAMEFQDPAKKRPAIPLRVIAAVAIAFTLLAIWYFTPISHLTDIKTVEPYFKQIAQSGWAPVAIPILFVVASMVFFPITVLIALTGMTLGPSLGILCAGIGSLGSAALSFALGTLIGEKGLRPLMGKRLNRLSRRLADKGVLSVAGLRLLPVAPFTAINLIAGASHIRFADFMIGTVLGMAPGIILMTTFGDRLREVLHNPSVENLVVLGLVTAGWLAAAFGLQHLISKYRKSR